MKANLVNQEQETLLTDSFGRIARKLRISVTDRCNLQCIYCMPKNNNKWFDSSDILTFDEMIRFASIMSKLGIENIRLTGGEPCWSRCGFQGQADQHSGATCRLVP